VGKKKVKKGVDQASKLPNSISLKIKFFFIKKIKFEFSWKKKVTPNNKCRLRLLKLERIKDFLLMEQEFIQN